MNRWRIAQGQSARPISEGSWVQIPLRQLPLLCYSFSMRNGEYTLMVAPEEYPGKRYRDRYVYEHHVVYWQTHGVVPGRGEVVHHKNKDKRDNRPENLELITTKDHNKHHHTDPNSIIELPCSWCGVPFSTPSRNVRWKKKNGQTNFFCCRSHQVRAQQAVIRGTRVGSREPAVNRLGAIPVARSSRAHGA